jgi:hypothetical protein
VTTRFLDGFSKRIASSSPVQKCTGFLFEQTKEYDMNPAPKVSSHVMAFNLASAVHRFLKRAVS